MIVGMAGRLAKVRLHLIVVVVVVCNVVARVVADAAAVIAGCGALEQCGSALVQCRFGAILQ